MCHFKILQVKKVKENTIVKLIIIKIYFFKSFNFSSTHFKSLKAKIIPNTNGKDYPINPFSVCRQTSHAINSQIKHKTITFLFLHIYKPNLSNNKSES